MILFSCIRPERLVKAWKTGTRVHIIRCSQTHCQTYSVTCSSRSQQEDLREYWPKRSQRLWIFNHNTCENNLEEVYHLTNQFRRENADVVGDKPVKNDAGEMSKDTKMKACLEHYQRLSTWSLTGTQITCLTNHQWKACPSQSPLIW